LIHISTHNCICMPMSIREQKLQSKKVIIRQVMCVSDIALIATRTRYLNGITP